MANDNDTARPTAQTDRDPQVPVGPLTHVDTSDLCSSENREEAEAELRRRYCYRDF